MAIRIVRGLPVVTRIDGYRDSLRSTSGLMHIAIVLSLPEVLRGLPVEAG